MPPPGESDEPQYKRAYQNDPKMFWVPDKNGLLEIPYKFVDGNCKYLLYYIQVKAAISDF